jgi:small-conductance mechanosensitive channel
LLAALGIAIGAAWGGLLSNFAAGMFLLVLRPFKVGDMITVGGVTGDVREIGLFVTNQWGTIIAVRPFCNNAHYWQVFFDTNKAINDVGSSAKFAVPEQRVATRSIG